MENVYLTVFSQGCLLLPAGLPSSYGIAPTLLQQRAIEFIKSPSDSFPDCAVVSGKSGGKLLVSTAYLAGLTLSVDTALASATEPTELSSLITMGEHARDLVLVVTQIVTKGGASALSSHACTPNMVHALHEALPQLQAHHVGTFAENGATFTPSAHAASQKSDAISRLRSSGFMAAAELERLQLHDVLSGDPTLATIAADDWVILASTVDQVAGAVIAELDPSEGAAWCDATELLPASLPAPLLQAFMQHTAKAVQAQLDMSVSCRLTAEELCAFAGLPAECDVLETRVFWFLGAVFVSRDWAVQLGKFLEAHGRLERLLKTTLQEGKRVRADLLASLRAAETQVSIAQLSRDEAGASPKSTTNSDTVPRQDSIGSFVMVDLDEVHSGGLSPTASSSGGSQTEPHAAAVTHLAAMQTRLQAVQKALSVWDISMTAVLNAEKHCNARAFPGCSDSLPVLCFEDPAEALAMALLQSEELSVHVEAGCDIARVFHAAHTQQTGDLLVLALTEGGGEAVGPNSLNSNAATGAHSDSLWQALCLSFPGGAAAEAVGLFHPVVLAVAEIVAPVSRAAARVKAAHFAELSEKRTADAEAGQAAPSVSPQLGGLPSHPPVPRKHALWAAHAALVSSVDAAAPLARGCFDMAVVDGFPRIPRDHWSVDLVQAQELAHKLAAKRPWLAEPGPGTQAGSGMVETVQDNLQRSLARHSAMAFTTGLAALVSDLLLLRAVVHAGKAAPGALSALALSALGAALEQLRVQPPSDTESPDVPTLAVFPDGLPLLAAYMPSVLPVQAQLEMEAAGSSPPILPQELLSQPQRDAVIAWVLHTRGPAPSDDGSPSSMAQLELTRVDSAASTPAAAAAAGSHVLPDGTTGHSPTQGDDDLGVPELVHLLAVRVALLALPSSAGTAQQGPAPRVPVVQVLCAIEAAVTAVLPTPEVALDGSDSDGSEAEEHHTTQKRTRGGGKRGKGGKGGKGGDRDSRKALPQGRKGRGTRASPWVGKHRSRGKAAGTAPPLASNGATAAGLLTSLAATAATAAISLDTELIAISWAVLAAAPQDDVGVGGQVALLVPVLQRKSDEFSQQWCSAVSSLGKGGSLVACLLRTIVDDKDKKLKRQQKAEHSAALHAVGAVASGKISLFGDVGGDAGRVCAVQIALTSRSTLGVSPLSADTMVWTGLGGSSATAILLLSSMHTEQSKWLAEWGSSTTSAD